MSDERQEHGANGVLEAEAAQGVGDSVASALEAAAEESRHAGDSLVMARSSPAPERDHFGRPLGYSLEALQGVDPFPSVDSTAGSEHSALREDQSVPPVDLDGGFFDGPASEGMFDLEGPDPRLLQKMTSAAALRRAHLRKYVAGAVSVAAALCVAALIKGAVVPHGQETAAADSVLTAATGTTVAAVQPSAVTLSPLPSAMEIIAPPPPQAADPTAASASAEAPSAPSEPSAAATADTAKAAPSDRPVVAAAPSASAAPVPAAPAAPVAPANSGSTAVLAVAPAAPPSTTAPAAAASPTAEQPAPSAAAANHPSAGGDSAKAPAPVVAGPATSTTAAADATPDPHLAAREKTRSQGALESGRLAEAVSAGEHSVALDPSDAETWLILGGAYQARGDQKNAQRCFRSCVGQANRGPKTECAALAQSK